MSGKISVPLIIVRKSITFGFHSFRIEPDKFFGNILYRFSYLSLSLSPVIAAEFAQFEFLIFGSSDIFGNHIQLCDRYK